MCIIIVGVHCNHLEKDEDCLGHDKQKKRSWSLKVGARQGRESRRWSVNG